MNRIEEEKKTVEAMIRLYCLKYEKNKELCSKCRELIEYANARLDRCKFGNSKTTCQNCPVHCYRKDMRDKIREVMRFAGPRMILYHPVMAVLHLVRTFTDKRHPNKKRQAEP